jgi:hypothetical protein
MGIKKGTPFVLGVLVLLILGSLLSCNTEIFNPTKLGIVHVGAWGGAVPYGSTQNDTITMSQVPHTESFELTVVNGEGPINIQSISDVTDQDDLSWHKGNLTIAYADWGKSFSITPDPYTFTITLADKAGGPAVTSGTTYEIEVAVENSEGIVPDPFLFRYRVLVNP